MKAILKQEWDVLDFSKRRGEKDRHVKIGPGTFELERIPNPFYPDRYCLVLKGTTIGMSEPAFRQWRDDDNTTGVQGDDEIWIEE